MNFKKSYRLLILTAIISGVTACSNGNASWIGRKVADTHSSSLHQSEVNTPSDAIDRLLEGNGRYCAGQSVFPNADQERRTETVPHQAPFAAIVGCSDSRVPVELIFDQGIGDLFVIRTAGNNVKGKMAIGSVDYAVKHLGVKLLLVLAHGSCGGVTAAISEGEENGALAELVAAIRTDVNEFVGEMDKLDDAIRMNARKQVDFILSHEHIREAVNHGGLMVLPAFYDIESGKVTIYGNPESE